MQGGVEPKIIKKPRRAPPWGALSIRKMVRAAQASPDILSPCSFLLWILTHKRFHSNLAIAPTCDTVSTYHITDKARDPQRGLRQPRHIPAQSQSPGACGVPAAVPRARGGDAAASDLQIKGGGARQGTVKGTAAGKATGLHLGQGGKGG